MDSPAKLPATLPTLLILLDQGKTLLLPNGRAAGELRAAYDARQQAEGLSAWQPARAISWQQWATSLYNELIVSGVETRLLLNAAQEQSVWSAIIDDDPPPGMIASNDALAELAASAFQLAAAWGVTSQLHATAASDDTRTFAAWASTFQDRCGRDRYLSASMLDAALSQHIASGTLPAPPELHLIGFDRLTPSQQGLLDALQNSHTEILRMNPVDANSIQHHSTLAAADPLEELSLAAQWLRRELVATDPPPRIAVLMPDIAKGRAGFETILREVLAPELLSINADLSSVPWEFATGEPLTSLALIADALDLARWSIGPLPQSRISALLLSPYLNPGAGRERAAQLDARLRRREKRLRPELSLDSFLRLLDKHGDALAWPRHLATEIARAGDLSRPRSFAAWMEAVRNFVQATGWPSSALRSLSATEFEVTRAWDGVLDLVATLDFRGQRVSLQRAVEALEHQARSTGFTPPSTRAPVQIMRPADVEGSLFDAVLFLHATDANLPVPEHTHPLLAWTLQSSLSMPGTDPVRSAAHAGNFARSLLDRTGNALFMYAAKDANGELRPSPLLSELRLSPLETIVLPAPAVPLAWDLVADGEPLPALLSSEVQGGSRLLQLQAACGFRAFAELRLNASEPGTAEIGLDAAQSGSIVHKVLQQLWTKLESQAELAALDPHERRALLELCIADALRGESAHAAAQWDEAYLSVIRERLLRLMSAWVEVELERGPFVIQGCELEEEVSVGPLKIKVRVDRVDGILHTEEGAQRVAGSVLIDYKTGGSANPTQWGTPRPEEPQLPLYTLLFEPGEVKAIAFAKLIAGQDMRWLGLQSETGILSSTRARARIDDLDLTIDEWRSELNQLAHDFANGVAHVSPKHPIKTCQYCALRILCRVNELSPTPGDESEEDDGE